MRKFKYIFNVAIWAFLGILLSLVILTRIPPIQQFIGSQISLALENKLGTSVSIGRVDLGFFNRFIIDDVKILDQDGHDLLSAGRISAKFDFLPLTEGRISISSAQLFGMKACLSKPSATGKANFQFVLDALASKDTTKHTPLDIAIKSLIIRNGNIKYDQDDVARTNKLSLKHLEIANLSTHIMLNSLTDDSLNLFVKKLSCTERSGLEINNLSFDIIANKRGAVLKHFAIALPHSKIAIPRITGTYRKTNGKVDVSSIRYEGEMNVDITPSDLSFLEPSLRSLNKPFSILTKFGGTGNAFKVNHLSLHNATNTIIKGNGAIFNWDTTPQWDAEIKELIIKAEDIAEISEIANKQTKLPVVVARLGDIGYAGRASGLGKDVSLSGVLTTGAGSVTLLAGKNNNVITGEVTTKGLDLEKILDDKHFGTVAASLHLKGTYYGEKITTLIAQGTINQFEYNNYNYKNISVDGKFDKNVFTGNVALDDANGIIDLGGTVNLNGIPSANIQAKVRKLNLAALKITDRYNAATFNADIKADMNGRSANDALGKLTISDFVKKDSAEVYTLSSLEIKAEKGKQQRRVEMNSDFGHIVVNGQYDYNTILQSLTNIVGSKLPTFPGLPKTDKSVHNDFAFDITINKSDWLQHIFNVPLNLERPFVVKGSVNDHLRKIDMTLNMPRFEYDGKNYERGYMRLASPNDTLKAFFHLKQNGEKQVGTYWNIRAHAANNKLHTLLSFENNGKNSFSGLVDTETQFYKNEQGLATARLNIQPSKIAVGDSIWTVRPATINYYKKHLSIDKLAIEHNKQHIIVAGNATSSPDDTLTVDLQDVDVSYILNLVNFHSVEFSGKATGYAYLSAPFGTPEAKADLWVRDFRFENGRMGILSASASLNHQKEQIDIDATAYDDDNARTIIKGYISPKRNYIDLNINANNTRSEFLESFCGSFMSDVNLKTNGNVRVVGDLKRVNLEGKATVDGTVAIKPLNTVYTLNKCPIILIPDEIKFDNAEIKDRNGNAGVVSGSVYHKHLTKLSYDIKVDADNLLAYDFKDYGDNTFYGTVFATGDTRIRGKSGELTIDANITPEKGSFIEYNAASPDAINNQSFIHWADRDSVKLATAVLGDTIEAKETKLNMASDIHMNLNINCTPDATLRVLMDKQSGDYIALNGNGVIRATYFNKGDFDMFGTYEVDHGIYKLTIQNIIRRDFQFLPGSTIGFGGNAMEAQLNLKAQYVINGVSLSDLSIGKSFTTNNIRVNCLMNITGTPVAPRVDFGLDLPTISSDAKQMVTNLINSEEGMNQQVLYLLAVGRFYPQNNNNNTQGAEQQQSRTSLAMQSILSGTISQQLNNILNTVTKNDNWNFGANISTGDEGWNNAEYEGLLSGRMLNNRLLFNGQFGYRDNANATTSFIGDFDLQYLIYPNGNFAVRVYSQSNDRYFTKNSLNTQGLGLILKKDFNGWRDLLGIRKKKKSSKKKYKTKREKR